MIARRAGPEFASQHAAAYHQVSGGNPFLQLEKRRVGGLDWVDQLAEEYFRIPAPTDDDENSGVMTASQVNTLLGQTGFVDVATISVEMPYSLPDAAALWDWLTPRGVTDAVRFLPAERAEEFHDRFEAGVRRMQDNGGIDLRLVVTLHRARTP